MEEKKEIGIETLIELLNEYEIEKEKIERTDVDVYVEFEWGYTNYNGLTRWDKTDQREGDNLYGDTAVAYLISKSFGFIKWLVDNDKIERKNRDLLDKCMEEFDRYPITFDTCKVSNDATDMLLMLLSISDEPIDFLCKLIKN